MKRILLLIASAGLACCPISYVRAEGDAVNPSLEIINFGANDANRWLVVNDGVMGGISRGRLQLTDRETAVFSGELSLENNGGFASVRASVGKLDLSAHAGLEIRVRGDGRTYQLRLRTDDGYDGIAYRTEFETGDDEWVTIRRAFSDFQPTYRGRTPRGAPPLDPSRVHQIGFLLADKQPGAFSLEIDFVRTWRSTPAEAE